MNTVNKCILKVDWCGHDAAKYAVEHWHYSHSMPVSKLVKVGVWESDKFIGCVIFGGGTSKNFGSAYGLQSKGICELTRVALNEHKTPVSRIVSIAVKLLKKQSPGLRLIVSFADPQEGHNGGIYQAMNWVYVGNQILDKRAGRSYFKNGRKYGWRTVSAHLMKYPDLPQSVEGAIALGFAPTELVFKHKYLMPLDDAMRAKIAPLAKPYPKRDSCA